VARRVKGGGSNNPPTERFVKGSLQVVGTTQLRTERTRNRSVSFGCIRPLNSKGREEDESNRSKPRETESSKSFGFVRLREGGATKLKRRSLGDKGLATKMADEVFENPPPIFVQNVQFCDFAEVFQDLVFKKRSFLFKSVHFCSVLFSFVHLRSLLYSIVKSFLPELHTPPPFLYWFCTTFVPVWLENIPPAFSRLANRVVLGPVLTTRREENATIRSSFGCKYLILRMLKFAFVNLVAKQSHFSRILPGGFGGGRCGPWKPGIGYARLAGNCSLRFMARFSSGWCLGATANLRK
jgi:hypothetical protein